MTSRSLQGSKAPRRAGPGANVLVAAAVSALLASGTRPASSADGGAVVTDGRIRVLMASRPAAGYFTLENRGSEPLVLSAAGAPDCGSVMLHKSTTENGMSRMGMPGPISVPPHGTVRFAPGGYHLMCMQPSGVLLSHSGTEPVTLIFANGRSVSAAFAIEGVGSSGDQHQGASK